MTPRFSKLGGLELATQFNVLMNDPAAAARKLRDAAVPEGKKRRGSTLSYGE